MYSYKNLYNKILNPDTGIQVKINSSIGKKIVKKYLSFINSQKTGGTNSNPIINKIVLHFDYIKYNQISEYLKSLNKQSDSDSDSDMFQNIIKWVSDREKLEKLEELKSENILQNIPDINQFASHLFDKHTDKLKSFLKDNPNIYSSALDILIKNQTYKTGGADKQGWCGFSRPDIHGSEAQYKEAIRKANNLEKKKLVVFGAILLYIFWYLNLNLN